MSELVTSAGAFMIIIGVAVTIFMGGFVPFFIWRIARNTTRIGHELGRLNDTLERRPPAAETAKPHDFVAPAAASDNRTAHARPGALGI